MWCRPRLISLVSAIMAPAAKGACCGHGRAGITGSGVQVGTAYGILIGHVATYIATVFRAVVCLVVDLVTLLGLGLHARGQLASETRLSRS